MLETPRLSFVAENQLAAWETIARDWPLYLDGPCERCASCHQNVVRQLDVNGIAYQFTPEARLALTVAHLRQAHMDLDPDRG